MKVHGQTVDDETRCVHYRSPVDIVAIKFACCERFYPCHQCHADAERHAVVLWPRTRWTEQAILCGLCRGTMSITDYRAGTSCVHCGARFNDGCRAHAHLYFQIPVPPG